MIAMRATVDDERLFELLQKKLGLQKADIIRLGLRVLAAKEGVAA